MCVTGVCVCVMGVRGCDGWARMWTRTLIAYLFISFRGWRRCRYSYVRHDWKDWEGVCVCVYGMSDIEKQKYKGKRLWKKNAECNI